MSVCMVRVKEEWWDQVSAMNNVIIIHTLLLYLPASMFLKLQTWYFYNGLINHLLIIRTKKHSCFLPLIIIIIIMLLLSCYRLVPPRKPWTDTRNTYRKIVRNKQKTKTHTQYQLALKEERCHYNTTINNINNNIPIIKQTNKQQHLWL